MITLTGTAPNNEPIRMNADPVCIKQTASMGPQAQETYKVSGDKLANVFVYVKDGLGNYSYDPPAGNVTLDQHGCIEHAGSAPPIQVSAFG